MGYIAESYFIEGIWASMDFGIYVTPGTTLSQIFKGDWASKTALFLSPTRVSSVKHHELALPALKLLFQVSSEPTTTVLQYKSHSPSDLGPE